MELITAGITKLRKIGNSTGILLPKKLFKLFIANEDESLVVYYDEENDCVVLKKGGI